MNSEHKFRLLMSAINGTVSTIRTGLAWGFGTLIAYYLVQGLSAFAGQKSDANLALSLFASIQIDRWLAYIVAIMGAGYGLRQRQLRRSAIWRLTERPNELETRMDVGRTSSNLTPTGTTRAEDR